MFGKKSDYRKERDEALRVIKEYVHRHNEFSPMCDDKCSSVEDMRRLAKESK